eukprot:CAMPEP_0206538084 /NCGR_PEP_ID=MMETSP0325_2-20121206/7665_1 /ASSEMBLY_ACC=CAM_ASM_000347 /TAXON_ID=2866 /ORGANISM="Crypthecodinium cohnii, Strain Seligo" /LENGTH=99 /DNA_ID=CAMNT_0054035481 /DNA_START=98 /DNA_END=393 /DNA_ORIENTATION=-
MTGPCRKLSCCNSASRTPQPPVENVRVWMYYLAILAENGRGPGESDGTCIGSVGREIGMGSEGEWDTKPLLKLWGEAAGAGAAGTGPDPPPPPRPPPPP